MLHLCRCCNSSYCCNSTPSYNFRTLPQLSSTSPMLQLSYAPLMLQLSSTPPMMPLSSTSTLDHNVVTDRTRKLTPDVDDEILNKTIDVTLHPLLQLHQKQRGSIDPRTQLPAQHSYEGKPRQVRKNKYIF